MFGVYFGKFLVDEGALTEEQYNEIVKENRTKRLKLGPLAINEGYMSEAQAEEVNRLQTMQDRRFGDIAIEKGYITEEQLGVLLKKQGDSYLLFVKALVEKNIMSLEEIQNHINKYKKIEHFTAFEIDALKSSDIDNIIPLFTRDTDCPAVIKDYVALFARNIVRFIDNKVRFERIEKINQFVANYISLQEMVGDYKFLIALVNNGKGLGLRKFASIYAKEDFETTDLDVLDAICEFINVSNGLFATKLSEENVSVDMLPPRMKDEPTTISSDGIMYRLPVSIYGEDLDMIICMESKWNIE